MSAADPSLDLGLKQMKRIALALLGVAACGYVLALWLGRAYPLSAAPGYLAAFAEAAMVGAVADWFAVVALFRHPLGLPIPHTAIIPANKARIGAKLADFICDNFLATPQVLAKLAALDAARQLADWLSRPAHAERVGGWVARVLRFGLSALDDERVRSFIRRAATAGLARIDLSRVLGQTLGALTAGNRHQALLDDVLVEVAALLQSDALQQRVSDVIAREIRALRWVGLDQAAARLATRKIVSAVARTIDEVADHPGGRQTDTAAPEGDGAEQTGAPHPLRERFDQLTHRFVEKLQNDPDFIARGEQIRADLMAHPALADYLHAQWQQLLQWLEADLDRSDSTLRWRVGALAGKLGEHLAGDADMRRWIDEQIMAAAPALIERHREDIRRYIAARVGEWDTAELTDELERHIGRDLQFIRINGTLVGGLVGLTIHALTQWAG